MILDAAAKLRMLRPELAAFVTCSVLAVVMGVRNADSLNHDAVSYVTLAQHYLDGRFDLVVVGTWSPLFVWLLVPLIAATGDHGLSLHLLSGFSALVFLTGGLAALRAFAPRSGVAPGAIVLAVYGAVQSGALMTPDLLSAGLFGFATARIMGLALAPTPSASQWATAGALIGLCYLAKAVLLPIGVLCLLMVLGARILLHGMRPRLAARAAAGTLAGVLLVGGPWMAALSFKYGAPTFSTTGPIAFAAIGPPDADRNQPTNRLFVIPEPGRQSQFEDESILPQASWSPLDSPHYARHFARHIAITSALSLPPSANWTSCTSGCPQRWPGSSFCSGGGNRPSAGTGPVCLSWARARYTFPRSRTRFDTSISSTPTCWRRPSGWPVSSRMGRRPGDGGAWPRHSSHSPFCMGALQLYATKACGPRSTHRCKAPECWPRASAQRTWPDLSRPSTLTTSTGPSTPHTCWARHTTGPRRRERWSGFVHPVRAY